MGCFFLWAFWSCLLNAGEIAFVASPADRVVYRVDLDSRVVQKIHEVEGEPLHLTLVDTKLLVEWRTEDAGGQYYIDVFDVTAETVIKRISTGIISDGPVRIGDELIYALQKPHEIMFLDLNRLTTASLPLPDGFIPVSVARGPRGDHVFVVAGEYEHPINRLLRPRRKVLIEVFVKERRIAIRDELPKHSGMIMFLDDRFLLETGDELFTLYAYPDRKVLREFRVPYFCQFGSSRQLYAAIPQFQQFVIAGGFCPGTVEFEKNEISIAVISSNGDLVWKVTHRGDDIPPASSVAVLPDGGIAFVNAGFGLGILDPKTGKLLRQIEVGNGWSLAVGSLRKQQPQ
jgi:hypothetical protein